MANPSTPSTFTKRQIAGMVVLFGFVIFSAQELHNATFVTLSFPAALGLATLGGAVGGVLICARPMLAGLIGGLLAGPPSLIAYWFVTQGNVQASGIAGVAVLGVASLPGIGVGWLLKKRLSRSAAGQEKEHSSETRD